MRGLKVFLFVSLFANVFYILGLVFAPALLRQFEMAPQEVMWVWYLVPIYLAITFGNWLALRIQSEMLAWFKP